MPDYPLPGLASQPTSIAEMEWLGAEIETARIINVNIETWSVDCIAEHANKRYFDVQVMAPYFHFANGEGIYAQPEVGSLCWLCTPSSGRFAAPFVLGFQSAHDEDFDSFRGGRQTLNPGDIMMRTRDENFLILRRGGVIQIGSTPVCQTMYVPIGNMLRHFCEQYELNTFGGSLEWKNTRTDETADGEVLTTLTLKAKEKVSTPEHDVVLTIGSHGDGEPTRLVLVINDSGDDGNAPMVTLTITNEGNVSWALENDFALEAKTNIQLTAKEGDITVKAEQGNYNLEAGSAVGVKAGTDFIAEAGANATVKSGAVTTLDGPAIHLGANAPSPVVKGDMLVSFLGTLLGQIAAFVCGPPGSPVAAAPAVASLNGQLSGLLSTVSFTK